MKAVMLSLRPQWCELIFNGEKTIEVRKSRPYIPTPFTVYVYQTKHKGGNATVREVLNSVYGGGKVIGSFVCDRVDEFDSEWSEYAYACAPTDIPCAMPMSEENAIKICKEKGCMTLEDIIDYFGDEEWRAYFWHITEPKLFDKPRDITEFVLYGKCAEDCKDRMTCKYFKRTFLKRPPMSWYYIEADEN